VADPDHGDRPLPAADVRRVLAPLLHRPAGTAILTDFDGTLSPIVASPESARPVAGVVDVLSRLSERFGVVAVVSGRPVSFLIDQLTGPVTTAASAPTGGPRFFGLYGLEWSDGSDGITVEPAALPWVSVVDEVAARLERTVPAGALVESKGLAVTVHWRTAPQVEPAAHTAVLAEAHRTGLEAHPGRRSVELRPPLHVDKGSVTRALAQGCSAAAFFGDDLGDLPAFAALDALSAQSGMSAVKVAVADLESAPEVTASADLVLDGPGQALTVLEWLAES
jgi:trehalose 6-phosphate phosphatase